MNYFVTFCAVINTHLNEQVILVFKKYSIVTSSRLLFDHSFVEAGGLWIDGHNGSTWKLYEIAN